MACHPKGNGTSAAAATVIGKGNSSSAASAGNGSQAKAISPAAVASQPPPPPGLDLPIEDQRESAARPLQAMMIYAPADIAVPKPGLACACLIDQQRDVSSRFPNKEHTCARCHAGCTARLSKTDKLRRLQGVCVRRPRLRRQCVRDRPLLARSSPARLQRRRRRAPRPRHSPHSQPAP